MINRIARAIDWLKTMEHPDGGIRGAVGYEAYPEVTGYLLPSLRRYGAQDLSERCAKWLLHIQNWDGGWDGWMSGKRRLFDTGMIYWGLAGIPFPDLIPAARKKARVWMESHRRRVGDLNRVYYLPTTPGGGTHYYMAKAEAAIGMLPDYWLQEAYSGRILEMETKHRLHYLSYLFEGLKAAYPHVLDQLPVWRRLSSIDKPYNYWYNSNLEGSGPIEVLSNFQMSILLDDYELFLAMARTQNKDGSFPHTLQSNEKLSWVSRYFLEGAWHFRKRWK